MDEAQQPYLPAPRDRAAGAGCVFPSLPLGRKNCRLICVDYAVMASLACSLSAPCSSSLRSSFQGESLIVDNAGSLCQVQLQGKGALVIEAKESRIGKAPIPVPKGVTVNLDGQNLSVKGALGELVRTYPREVKLTNSGEVLLVERAVESRRARQMHGLFRTLTDNMVIGVSKGFEKRLQLIGVGYRAAVEKDELALNLGFSHQVRMKIPEAITVKVEENTRVIVSGKDKCAVGDFSAAVRKWRPPEPYKGKGIKYSDEVIRRKEGKVGKKK
eukprot:XP_024367957.1 50S ribosomal protein L6, chloroplastic-like isoform X2 [Physcomitrella patens]